MQGPHDQEPTSRHNAAELCHSLAPRFDVRSPKAAGAVRAWKDAERAVVGAAVVEMHPYGHHALKHRDWWLHVVNSCLDAPGAIALDLTTSPDGDGEILMPRDLPVRGGRLVEQQGPNGKGIRTEDRRGRSPHA